MESDEPIMTGLRSNAFIFFEVFKPWLPGNLPSLRSINRIFKISMSKKKALIVLFYSSFGFCSAQSLSHSVIGAAGDTFHSSNGSLDWTLGEIMTEAYIQNGKMLTQGFQ